MLFYDFLIFDRVSFYDYGILRHILGYFSLLTFFYYYPVNITTEYAEIIYKKEIPAENKLQIMSSAGGQITGYVNNCILTL